MMRCPGFNQSGIDCFGHGVCNMGKCSCAQGWGMAPQRLFQKPQPLSCMDKICPVGCGMHGKCVEGVCVCQQGWQGPNCKDPQCPNNCAGHGQCSFQSPHSPGQCICNYGWGGAGCQRVALYAQLQQCPNDCSGNGLCMNGMCACNVGFSGADCTEIICSGMMTGPKCDQQRCPNDCSGRGLCMNGVCACWAAYAGNSCRMPVACRETCYSVCEAPGREERCISCIGSCESSAPRTQSKLGGPPLGLHNPFEDLQSTFLQKNATPVKPGYPHPIPAASFNTHQHLKKVHHTSAKHHHHHHEVSLVSFPQRHSHHHFEVSATEVTPLASQF
jgi:hypothetical protein